MNRIAHVLLAEIELLAETRPELPPEAVRASDLLATDAERLRRLLDRISALVALEKDPGETAVEEVDLARLIQSIAVELGTRHPNAVTVQAPPALFAATQPHAVGRIVTILIENALAHGDGSVRVVLRSDETGHHVEVSDEGPGLPAALAEVAFEPFAAVRLGFASRGSGLGLHLANRLAESIGATLTHGTAPRGARFHLTFPRRR